MPTRIQVKLPKTFDASAADSSGAVSRASTDDARAGEKESPPAENATVVDANSDNGMLEGQSMHNPNAANKATSQTVASAFPLIGEAAQTVQLESADHADTVECNDETAAKIDAFLLGRIGAPQCLPACPIFDGEETARASPSSAADKESAGEDGINAKQIFQSSNDKLSTKQTTGAGAAHAAVTSKAQTTALPRHDWSYYYDLLKEYKAAHGTVNVPVGHLLYTWIEQQKAYMNYLSPVKTVALQKLGVVFPFFIPYNPSEPQPPDSLDLSSNPPIKISNGLEGYANPKRKDGPPEDWEVNILEKNDERPWWKDLTSQPTRRSARVSEKLKSPEKANDTRATTETASPKTDSSIPDPKKSRAERAKRRLSRFGELPEPSPKKKRPLIGACKAAHENAQQKKKSTTAANPKQGSKVQEVQKVPTPAPKPGIPIKENYSEKDIKKVSKSNRLLHQPCTIMDGKMTSGFITLTLPSQPLKLGLYLKFNPIFNFVELEKVDKASPLAIQIPVDFRTDCFITSIESWTKECFVPSSVPHCVHIFNRLRQGKKVIINFAKNPMALFMPKDDPPQTHSVPAGLKQCNGPCGLGKPEAGFSSVQWNKPKDSNNRLCLDCMKKYKDLETPAASSTSNDVPRNEGKPAQKSATETSVSSPLLPRNPPPYKNPGETQTKLCSGRCGLIKTRAHFSPLQWEIDLGEPRVCKECLAFMTYLQARTHPSIQRAKGMQWST